MIESLSTACLTVSSDVHETKKPGRCGRKDWKKRGASEPGQAVGLAGKRWGGIRRQDELGSTRCLTAKVAGVVERSNASDFDAQSTMRPRGG